MKRRYRRYFIMLEAEDKSSSIVQKEAPKGYGKIEVKNDQGILTISCQNLKSDSKSSRYRWYLINTKKDGEPTIVEVGPMELDSKGKGEIVWEFNSENVKGSMEAIDNFNVLALASQNKDDRKNLFIPLIGYMDKEKLDGWRYALEKYLYIPSKKDSEPESNLKSKVHVEPESEPIKKVEPKLDEVTESDIKEVADHSQQEEKPIPKDELNISRKEAPAPKDELNISKKEAPIQKEEVDILKEETQPIEENKEYIPIKGNIDEILKNPEKEKTEEMNDEESYGAQMQGYIESALKDFPKVNPFISNIENYTWWQIPYNYQTIYRSYMPFISYVDSVKGPANYYTSKMIQTIYLHQHHIFGILYDANNIVKYYAYGIPGRKHPSEQPYEGATGFNYWHPCDPGPQDMYSHGYWMLFIDPKTGKVIKDLQL